MQRLPGILIAILILVFMSPVYAQETAPAASSDSGLWLNVNFNSPSDKEEVKAQLPLTAMADIIKALPESVKGELEEQSIPLGWIAILAKAVGDFKPLTIWDQTDAETQEKLRIWTQARVDKSGKGAKATLLKGLVSEDPKSSTATREFAIPLSALDLLSGQLKQLDTAGEFFKKPEEMKKAIEITAAALANSYPGDLVRIKSEDLNLHLWIE